MIMTKIYDCFTFFNELDLLELRLMELYDVVDKFVIVEANKTFSGKPKNFVFEENKLRYKKYLKKIIYIKVKNFPPQKYPKLYNLLVHSKIKKIKGISYNLGIGPWTLEYFQRNAIMRGLKNLKDKDIVLISDLDEIPSKEGILLAKKKLLNNECERIIFKMTFFVYWYNAFRNNLWYGTKAVLGKTLKFKLKTQPQIIRTGLVEIIKTKILHLKYLKDIIIESGWHFSYMGGIEKVKEKIQSFAHTESDYNKLPFINDELGLKYIKITKQFPKWIYNNRLKLIKLKLAIKLK